MVTSQSVFAVGAVLILSVGTLARARGRHVTGNWLLGIGFAVTTLWAVLGAAYPQATRGGIDTRSYVLFATMAGSFSIYFVHTALHVRPV